MARPKPPLAPLTRMILISRMVESNAVRVDIFEVILSVQSEVVDQTVFFCSSWIAFLSRRATRCLAIYTEAALTCSVCAVCCTDRF